ncbi:trimeric intracellular cation channel type 1B.1-like [Saccoglossus kowalevskii]|uniref:Trimeric intracellular cation channel type B-A-like n=1 Tax=Saccoglossus kowalevskii TaxID=10224 RepID=A0ABM0GPL0_SACKO|nr:PREDICTED: trimeric intracellular cation channel type B-A-like [Saccoglossus kowalevskii]
MGDFLEMLHITAEWFSELSMFPLFDIAHYILMIAAVRKDAGIEFSRKNPLACWLCSLLSSFAGGVIANFLLAQPILGAFESPVNIATATIVWYLVFYSPYDLFHKIVMWSPVYLVVLALKEVTRPRKILGGIAQTAKVFPKAYHLMVLIGVVKASGSNWMKNFERLARGVWTPTSNELMKPSFVLKVSVVGSVLFVLQKQGTVSMSQELLLLLYSLFLIFWKVSMTLVSVPDPFVPLEGLSCFIFFGSEEDTRVKKQTADRKKKKE